MRWLKPTLSLVATAALVLVLNTKLGPLPPLGKFLDPFHGFWQNAETDAMPAQQELDLAGLMQPVTVLYDERRVPHIFAENDHDLYFAQGYVTARDRLWQMEFQTHAAAGRLSEIVGPATLAYDRFQRRIGMTHGARNALKAMQADSVSRIMVQAYSRGVNAYIASLEPDDYPLEYKILDYAPEPWTPYKCALLLKYMAWMLAGRSTDLQMSNTLLRFGPEVIAELYPEYHDKVEPIIPAGTEWNFTPVQVQKPDAVFRPAASGTDSQIQPHAANGSNNWAVSGNKMATGYPLLANDPHLTLSLPSIWYEMQLVSPQVNVYGMTLPGAPNVIVGFNQRVAWGVTNADADVMDWYEIKFRDESRQEYWHDGRWQAVERVVEQIEVRGEGAVLDTVLYTHHGPIALRLGEIPFSRQTPVLHAVRWLGHDPSEEALAFYKLNRARNYDDYVGALKHYSCPAQNFVYADANDTIAIWHNGKLPAKWRGQGKFISDGSDPLYDWQAWIPHEHNPHIVNPERGFVSSANQQPTDPSYPYYLNWGAAEYYRGARINEWLRTADNLTADDFRVIQLDAKNLHAESVLPAMLRYLRGSAFTETERFARNVLDRWDYFNDAGKIAPTIFDAWWDRLYRAIWADEFSAGNLVWPGKSRTARLVAWEPEAKWFDNTTTEAAETVEMLAAQTFKDAVAALVEQLGARISPNAAGEVLGDGIARHANTHWTWGRYKDTEIKHVGRIPGLGRRHVITGGDLGIVNATGRRHGPSWRMVVSLGPQVEGWGIYPGGQSGNPGSPFYDNMVDDWAAGELHELLFLESADLGDARIVARMHLK